LLKAITSCAAGAGVDSDAIGFDQSGGQQSAVQQLLRDNDVQRATWLSGKLQQTTYMATSYRWINSRSTLILYFTQSALPDMQIADNAFTLDCFIGKSLSTDLMV